VNTPTTSIVPTPASIAIRVQAIHQQMGLNYTDLLERLVFIHPPRDCDRKTLRTYRNILLSDESDLVLTIFWKESDFVTDDDVISGGAARIFPRGTPITCYALAVKLYPNDSTKIAAANSRVRAIAAAASAYGLIEKSKDTRKKFVSGTALLHEFMTTLGQENEELWSNALLRWWPDRLQPLVAPSCPGRGRSQ
jgi:hypothetical protein